MKQPTPKEIRSARDKAGLTQTQAALLVYSTLRTWQNWEAPIDSKERRPMPASIWVLFQLRTKQLKLSDL